MSINQIIPINFKKFPVGKFIGSSKIKYEWEMNFEDECLFFVGYYSKNSKSVRLFLNNIKLMESLNTDNDFSVIVKVEKATFIFIKKNEELELIVNSCSFEQTLKTLNLSKKKSFASWQGKKPKTLVIVSDPKKSLYHTDEISTTRQLVGIVFEWTMGVCVVQRLSQIRLADAIYLPTIENTKKKENDELAENNLKDFEFLENSAEFYSHEFFYLFTQEVTENYEMIELVNGEKCGTDLDNTDGKM